MERIAGIRAEEARDGGTGADWIVLEKPVGLLACWRSFCGVVLVEEVFCA